MWNKRWAFLKRILLWVRFLVTFKLVVDQNVFACLIPKDHLDAPFLQHNTTFFL